jgi:hypothetical protein
MKKNKQNSVHQLVETLKEYPNYGLTENDLMYKTFGYDRNTSSESNKKYADMLRRGMKNGLIRREEYKPNRFKYFVNEGVEVDGKDIFVYETPNQNPSLDGYNKSKSECKKSRKFISDKEVEDLFNYFDEILNKETKGKHVISDADEILSQIDIPENPSTESTPNIINGFEVKYKIPINFKRGQKRLVEFLNKYKKKTVTNRLEDIIQTLNHKLNMVSWDKEDDTSKNYSKIVDEEIQNIQLFESVIYELIQGIEYTSSLNEILKKYTLELSCYGLTELDIIGIFLNAKIFENLDEK